MTKSTGMGSSYPLDENKIDEKVTTKKIGTYCLGHLKASNNAFVPDYVGRSDTDLNKRLKDWVGKYKRFKFMYHTTKKQAYEKECNLYHDWKDQIDNDVHPDKPDGTDYKCPVCGQ